MNSTVHPRACGELSPTSRSAELNSRFIPAHAGNSTELGVLQRTDSRASVHPRACGETLRPCPTYEAPQSVHPRACGELIDRLMLRQCDGSSPRMRGTPSHYLMRCCISRFFPAHAGNSLGVQYLIPLIDGSSPRMRGTPEPLRPLLTLKYGSSPRMRGTLGLQVAYLVHERFIPAHAGNSCLANAFIQVSTGSSPRMRGTQWCPSLPSSWRTVHPRACGELPLGRRVILTGSSPRMRGGIHSLTPVHPRACGELSSWKLMIVNVLRDRKERTKYSLYFPGRWERVQTGRISQAKPLSDRCRMIEA